MTVFKTFLKVLNAFKVPVIMYTVFLILFAGINMQSDDNNTDFVSSKPDILIVNNDENIGITNCLTSYIEKNSNIVNIKNDENSISDALFYRDINYIIYIPENYREDFLNNKNPEIEVRSTGDYNSSLAELMLEKFINTANIYKSSSMNEDEIINNINNTLSLETNIEITSKLDTTNLNKLSRYYSFANYSILAGCVYAICLVLSSFKSEKIRKRTVISSMDYKKFNRKLLIANSLFAFVFWLFYVILSYFLMGDILFTSHGLLYILNSFVFTFCALTIALLLGNIVNDKNALNGMINVIALGSSFLCGAFVPMEWLPNFVLTIAHALPSYWYIKSNEVIKTLEVFDFESLKPIFINMIIIIIFSILFIIITNIISKKKSKIN